MKSLRAALLGSLQDCLRRLLVPPPHSFVSATHNSGDCGYGVPMLRFSKRRQYGTGCTTSDHNRRS
jgi:hypothetical protein